MTPGETKQFVQDLDERATRLENDAKLFLEQAKALRATIKVLTGFTMYGGKSLGRRHQRICHPKHGKQS